VVLTPADISTGMSDEDLRTTAQIIEVLLITDHSRVKFEAATRYDSTHVHQRRLMRSPTQRSGLRRPRSSGTATTSRAQKPAQRRDSDR